MEETLLLPSIITPAPLAYPTIKESWGAVGWYLLVSLAVGIPVMLLVDVAFHLAATAKLLALAITSVAGLGLTILWLRRRAGPQRWPTLRLRGPQERWGWYALLPLLLVAQVTLLTTLDLLHLPNWTSKTFQEMAKNPMLALLFGCVAAPALEEVLFRGILLQGLLRNYRPAVAIAQSALLFGVFHFNPAQSLNAALIGLLLGWLYYQTHSLGMCIMLHALNNLSAFSAMRLTQLQDTSDIIRFIGVNWYVGLLALAGVVLGSGIWWLRWLSSQQQQLV